LKTLGLFWSNSR